MKRALLLPLVFSASLAARSQSWTNRYNGPVGGFDYPTAVAFDSSGNVYMTGQSANALGPDVASLVYATLKYSSAGTPVWTNRFNGTLDHYDGATAIAVDADGNVVVSGYADRNPYADLATIKYSNLGEPMWTNRSADRPPPWPWIAKAMPWWWAVGAPRAADATISSSSTRERASHSGPLILQGRLY